MKTACEEASRLASSQLEGELGLKDKAWMQMHFLMCSACRHFNENISKLHQALTLQRNKKFDNTTLPEDKRKKITSAIKHAHPD